MKNKVDYTAQTGGVNRPTSQPKPSDIRDGYQPTVQQGGSSGGRPTPPSGGSGVPKNN